MQINAQIRTINEIETFQNSEFRKQTAIFVSIETGTPFKIEFQNNAINLLKGAFIGSSCIVKFRIKGQFYDVLDKNGKATGEKDVFNTLVATDLIIF